jgi:hypothetical protein
MCPRLTTRASGQLECTATAAYRTKLVTPWILMIADGTDTVRLVDELQLLTDNYRHKGQYRTADVSTDFPNAWAQGTFRNGNGVSQEDLTPVTGALWIQAGIATSASSGSGEAWASIQLATPGRDQLIGSRSIEINPVVNSGENETFKIGQKFPAFGLTGLMMGVIYTGSQSGAPTVAYRPVVRYFNSEMGAGTWTDMANTSGNITANERRNFYETSLTTGNAMWGEIGLKLSTSTRGNFQVVAAAKY